MIRMLFIFLMYVVQAYEYIFIVYILLSFFPVDKTNFFVRTIDSICEPLYRLFLRFLPRLIIAMFDFSPVYVFIFLYILKFILYRLSLLFI